jgi:DNA-binding transcriptional MerR regulator
MASLGDMTLNNVTSNAVTSKSETSHNGSFAAVSAQELHDENHLTIEELAAETGMTVRNIRSHRARGLLPAPEVRDRVGYYGPEHLARLRMIQELQADGFNLKGIERLLNQNVGATEEFLSFRRALDGDDGEQPRTFTREELAERFGEDIDEALKRAVGTGALVAVEEDRYEAPYPSLLDAAEGVVATGVPLDHALTVIEKVRGRCKQISHEFVRLFLDDVWKPFEAEGYPAERWPEVREALDRLRPLSLQALAALHRMTLSDEVERALGKQLERMANRKG